MGYKPETGELSEAELDCLEALGQQVRAGDTIIKALLDANKARVAASETRFGSAFDFVTRMKQQFPDVDAFHQHASQLFDVLLELGIGSPTRIREELLGEDDDYNERSKELLHRLEEYLTQTNDKVVSVDPESSDALAVLLFDKKLKQLLDLYPTGRGRGRPLRLISLATRFQRMLESSAQQR